MKLRHWVAGAGEVASFNDESEYRAFAQDEDVLLLSEGRPTLAWNCWVPTSIWTPIRGTARLTGRDLRLEIATDDVFVAEQGTRLTFQSIGAQRSSLLGVLLPPERVCQIAQRDLGLTLEAPFLYPSVVRRDPALNVPLLRIAMQASRRGRLDAGDSRALDEVIIQLLHRQASIESLADRCPGRSPRYRRQVFLRLLRARNHIEHDTGADCSLSRLAEIARLSPTHFLRLYRDVFGRTPHKEVVLTRLSAARDLLLRTNLAVTEVCATLGFENRCAFARVFRQHFGISPTELRVQAGVAPRPRNSRVVALPIRESEFAR